MTRRAMGTERGDTKRTGPYSGFFGDICRLVPLSRKVFRKARYHLNVFFKDVIGLAFSPDGAQICSCSTDGSAIVFDVHKGTKLKILSDHKGWVNGVAWDPLGESVVTLASDRVLRVFKHKSFKVRCKTSKCQLPVGNRFNYKSSL